MKSGFLIKQITGLARKHCAAVLFFLLFFLYGLNVVRDYGVSWDEATERYSSLINLGYVIPEAKTLATDTVNYYGTPELSEYKDRYYGVAGQFPAILVEYLYQFQFNFHQIFLLRHMYTFTVFWTACIFFYLICRHFTHRQWLSLLGVFLLISSPRILADSFYNIKDLLFLSVFIITLWFGLLFIRRQTWPRLLAFGFFCGLCTNVRIVGAILAISMVIILSWQLFSRPTARHNWKKQLIFIIGSGLFSLLFYMAFTPIIWQNPIAGLKGAIETFSSYNSYTQPVFYMGTGFAPDQLPWHYLPVWILATTPVFYLFLMAAGLMFRCRDWLHTYKNTSARAAFHEKASPEKGFILLSAVFPLLYVLLRHPVLYNGWRHFYFIYPVMVLAALYGWIHLYTAIQTFLSRQGRMTALIVAVLILTAGICPTVLWIIQNHPFEYLYFNEIARPYAEEYFEKDYWGVSQLDALRHICQNDSREHIKVWTMTPSESRYLLNYEEQARIEIVTDLTVADYVIYHHASARDTGAINHVLSLYAPDYVKEIDGMAIYTIYRRSYTPYFRSTLEGLYTPDGIPARMAAETGGIGWEINVQDKDTIFTGRLAEPVYSDRIRLETDDSVPYLYQSGDLEVYLSADGITWTEAEIHAHHGYDYHCTFPSMDLAYIRLIHHQGGVLDNAWNMEVQILTPWSETAEAHQDTIIQASSASDQAQFAPLAHDRNLDTRWSNAQTPGVWYRLDLSRPITINQLRLVQAGYRTDFPAGLDIVYSMDGTDWNTLAWQSDDMETFTFASTELQYIRFQIPQMDSLPPTDWSIYEIQFFTTQEISADKSASFQ